MKLVLAEPHLLKESVNVISELVTEVIFKLNKEGIELKAMDPASVAMVIFYLSKSAFAEYKVEKEEKLALNLEQLKQVLKRAKPNDSLTLELNNEGNLQLKLIGDSARTFDIALIDLEETEQKTPSLKFPLSIGMSTNILNDALEDMGVISETVTFLAGKDQLDIKANSNLNSAKVEIKKTSEVNISLKDGNNFQSKYSLEYLRKMAKASKIFDRVNIFFSNEYPIKLEYSIPDKMQMSFILAPRIDND